MKHTTRGDESKLVPELLAKQRQVYRRAARQSTAHFLDCIAIPAGDNPKLLSHCADPWQREQLGLLIPAFEHLCGRNPDYRGPMNVMSIMARGHNKTSLQAWLSASAVLNSERHIHGYILAADRDQGRLLLQAQEDLLRVNPWLADDLTITKDTLRGPAGEITVLPFDASSGYGLRGNLYIADEFVHWKRQKEWTALVTGLYKIKPRLFVALSNAGLEGSWQHEAYLEAVANPDLWHVFHRTGTLASWLDPADIARDRRLIPPSEAERLFDNKWIDPAAEFDYLRRSEVSACEKLGVAMSLMVRLRRRVGVDNYVVAIDYGPRRDRTALVVMHLDQHGVAIIDRLDVWQGTPESPVQVAAVEEWVRAIRRDFDPVCWVLDPYQMEGTIQWMAREGMPVEAFASRNGAGNYEMAQYLRAAIVEGRLAWYPGAGNLTVRDGRTGADRVETLADELVALRVKKMQYGYRFDHVNQRHDDRAVAIGMALLRSVDFPAAARCTAFPKRLA